MVGIGGLDPRRYRPEVFAAIGIVALFLFLASFLVEVRIIVERPGYGDVTEEVRTVWQSALGIATIGSFLIAFYNISVARPRSESPASGLEIGGRNHDIDVHIYPDSRSDSGEDADEFPRRDVREAEARKEAGGSEDSREEDEGSATGLTRE